MRKGKSKLEGRHKFDLSQKRKKRKNKKFIIWSALLVLTLVGLAALTYAPFLNLHGIQITGTDGSEADKIKNLAAAKLGEKYYFVLPKSNILFYPRDTIKKDVLDKFPSVKTATVKTSLEGELLIQVEKREFNSLWCADEVSKTPNLASCYLVDQGGLIFAPAQGDELKGYLRLEGYVNGNPIGQTYGTPALYYFLQNFSKQLSGWGLEVAKFKYYNQDKAEAVLANGPSIFFLPAPSQEPELESNLSIFFNNLKDKNNGNLPSFQYIDARYGNKIFYKLQ